MTKGIFETEWSSGLRTNHPQTIQDKLNAGKNVFFSKTDNDSHIPGYGEPFTVRAVLPTKAQGENSGLLLEALKFAFQAYMGDPEKVAYVVDAMERAGRSFVHLRITIDEEGDLRILKVLPTIIKGLDF